jgi:hypothetical protein
MADLDHQARAEFRGTLPIGRQWQAVAEKTFTQGFDQMPGGGQNVIQHRLEPVGRQAQARAGRQEIGQLGGGLDRIGHGQPSQPRVNLFRFCGKIQADALFRGRQ